MLTDDDVYHRADECKKHLRHAEPDTWERIIEDAARLQHEWSPGKSMSYDEYRDRRAALLERCRALGVRLYG